MLLSPSQGRGLLFTYYSVLGGGEKGGEGRGKVGGREWEEGRGGGGEKTGRVGRKGLETTHLGSIVETFPGGKAFHP